MYAIYASLAAAAVVFGLTALWLGPIAGIIPALIVFGVVLAVIFTRRRRQVDAELKPLVEIFQGAQPRTPAQANQLVDRAVELIRGVQERHANWVPMLHGQLEAQIGMLDYQRLKFDDALPRLEAGRWRNWSALLCIGAIHFRKKRHDEAWEIFREAEDAAPKEVMVYVVPAVLQVRAGERDEALATLARGLKQLEGNPKLEQLRARVANKKTISPKQLPPEWYQFFPEDAAKVARTGGQLPPGMGGPPQPRMNRKMRRGR